MPAMTALEKPALRTVTIMPRHIPFPPKWARIGAGDRKLHDRISLSRKILSSLDSYALRMTLVVLYSIFCQKVKHRGVGPSLTLRSSFQYD